MPARLTFVKLYDDLEAAGGSCVSACWPWTALNTTYRTDGDHRLTGTIARTAVGGSAIEVGSVLRLERADDTVEEWIVAVARHEFGRDVVEVTGLPIRIWLAERVIVRDGTDVNLSGAGVYLEDAVDALIATDEWPAWLVAGTFDENPRLSYAWDATDGLTALLGLVTLANATDDIRLFGDNTLRLELRRVSGSQYAMDFLTDPPNGTPTIIEGKNLSSFAIRSERGQQTTSVLPIGTNGATIEEAYFWVREADAGADTIGVRDWSYRADMLVVAFDGQWVGHYIENSSGTRFEILDSVEATQTLKLAAFSGGDFATDDICRIVADSSGTPITEVSDQDATNPRRRLEVGTWGPAINWARNAQWRSWLTGPTRPAQWTANGGTTVSQVSGSADVETGLYALEIVFTTGTDNYKMNDLPQPDGILSPGGGSQNWVLGCRAYRTAGTATPQLQYSINGGSTWLLAAWITAATMTTYESGTFTTNSGTPPNYVQIRFAYVGGGTAPTIRTDRVWLFRSTADTGDNTVEGSDPARGIYYAARAMREFRYGARTYEVGLIDRYRDDPATYPNDNLTVAQRARVVVPSRSVDTTLTVAQLDVDELRPTKTNAQFGALRRRLTRNL